MTNGMSKFFSASQFRKEVRDGLIDLCYAFSGEEALDTSVR